MRNEKHTSLLRAGCGAVAHPYQSQVLLQVRVVAENVDEVRECVLRHGGIRDARRSHHIGRLLLLIRIGRLPAR